MNDEVLPQPIDLSFEDRVMAILKLLTDHAGITDDAVVKHLKACFAARKSDSGDSDV